MSNALIFSTESFAMNRMPKTTAMLSLLVAASLALLSNSAYGQRASRSNATIDVAASANGQLVGMLMHSGQPVAHQTVRLRAARDIAGSNPQVKTTTNANGEFSLSIPRGGVYVLQAANQRKVCRVWNASQAPPSAVEQVLLTCNAHVVRGQACGCGSATCNGGCGCGSTLGGFQNCDTCCGEPPILSNCENCSDFLGGCDCGTCCKGRNKLLVLMIGGAVAAFALDDNDGPVEADLGTGNAVGTAATPTPAAAETPAAAAGAGDTNTAS